MLAFLRLSLKSLPAYLPTYLVIYHSLYLISLKSCHKTLIVKTQPRISWTQVNNTEFNGMAPDAKVAVFDIGDDEGLLYLPPDINTGLFQVSHGVAPLLLLQWIYDYFAFISQVVYLQ